MDTGVDTASFHKRSSKDDGGLGYRSGLPSCSTRDARASLGFAVETLLCTAGHSAHRWPRPPRGRKHTVKCPLERPTGLGDRDAGRKQGTGPPRSGGGRGPADDLTGE